MHHPALEIVGLHTFERCDVSTPAAAKAARDLSAFLSSGVVDHDELGKLRARLHRFRTHERTYKNLVVTSGRNVLRDALGDPTFAGSTLITFGALGSGSSGAALSDTQLENETARVAVQSYDTTVDHVIDILTFWGTTEANGQHYEAGEFIGGTIAANSGNLFARWQINELKTSSETLTVQSTYTLNQVS